MGEVMIRKLIKEYKGISRYYYEGLTDIWGRRVYTRYCIFNPGTTSESELKDTENYYYKRSVLEKLNITKSLGKNVGTREFIECPLEYVESK